MTQCPDAGEQLVGVLKLWSGGLTGGLSGERQGPADATKRTFSDIDDGKFY